MDTIQFKDTADNEYIIQIKNVRGLGINDRGAFIEFSNQEDNQVMHISKADYIRLSAECFGTPPEETSYFEDKNGKLHRAFQHTSIGKTMHTDGRIFYFVANPYDNQDSYDITKEEYDRLNYLLFKPIEEGE